MDTATDKQTCLNWHTLFAEGGRMPHPHTSQLGIKHYWGWGLHDNKYSVDILFAA